MRWANKKELDVLYFRPDVGVALPPAFLCRLRIGPADFPNRVDAASRGCEIASRSLAGQPQPKDRFAPEMYPPQPLPVQARVAGEVSVIDHCGPEASDPGT